MTSTIFYEVEGGLPLNTARPDAFWCELVRVFVPTKSKEAGDDDPYGAGVIKLKAEHAPYLWRLSNDGWPEAVPLAEMVERGATIYVNREP